MSERLRKILSGHQIRIPDADRLRDDFRPNDDWAAGDLAECINFDGKWFSLRTREFHTGPTSKEVNKVIGVGSAFDGSVVVLEFSRYPGWRYISSKFRKITPKADAIERSDSSFIDLVRRWSKPADKQPPELKPERHREDA